MDVGIGLPTTIPDTEGSTLVEWARRAEEAGFSTLGTIGRLVYPNYDDLIALAAAAAVTERIRLTTSILIAPLHTNTALLAKQTASLDRLSGGRLVLAVGLGGRDDDYEASGLPTTGRGRRLEELLEELKRIWSGEERGYAGAIAMAVGLKQDEVFEEMKANLLPNARLVPAGIVAINRAQERGFALASVEHA